MIEAPSQSGQLGREGQAKEASRLMGENNQDKQRFAPTACEPDTPQPKGSNDIFCRQFRHFFSLQLPAYIRITVQDIYMIDLEHARADVSAILCISVYFGELPVEFVDKLHENIQLEISHYFHVYLRQRNFDEDLQTSLKTTRNEQTKIMTFVLRGIFPAFITCDIFWAPFERLKLSMVIDLTCLEFRFLGKPTRVGFNIMNWQNHLPERQTDQTRALKTEIKPQKSKNPLFRARSSQEDLHIVEQMFNLQHTHDFAEYAIIEQSRSFEIDWKSPKVFGKMKGLTEQIASIFTKQKPPISTVEQQTTLHVDEGLRITRAHLTHLLQETHKKDSVSVSIEQCFFLDSLRSNQVYNPRCWHVINFKIELMRYPLTALTTILVPVLCLSLINLVIYFQEVDLSKRISNIALVLLAFATFLPAIRSRIQQSPNFTLLEIMLYATIVSTFLCHVRSFVDRQSKVEPSEYKIKNDGFAIVSVVLLLLIVVSSIVIYVVRVYFFISRKRSKKYKKSDNKADLKDRHQWGNRECDAYRQTNELARQHIHFSTKFFQKENIFFRLWLWRYYCSQLPSQIDPTNEIQTIRWNEPRSLTYYQQQLLEAVGELYLKEFIELKRLVNCIMYLDQLDLRQSTPNLSLKSLYDLRREVLLSKIKGSAHIFKAYMNAKHRFVWRVMQLQEIITQDVEVWFKETDKLKDGFDGRQLRRIVMTKNGAHAQPKRFQSPPVYSPSISIQEIIATDHQQNL